MVTTRPVPRLPVRPGPRSAPHLGELHLHDLTHAATRLSLTHAATRLSWHGLVDVVDLRGAWPDEPLSPSAPASAIDGIGIHHDGVPAHIQSLAGDLDRIEAIHNWSVKQGWGRFPYHRVISRAGRIFYTVDIDRRGAHVSHRNYALKAIALMGDLTQQTPSTAQLCGIAAAIVMTYEDIGALAGIGPHKELVAPAHGDPWHSHATACPGDWEKWSPSLWPLVQFHARRLLDIRLDR